MVSLMALTCNHYAARCTKSSPKILRPKNSEKCETHPIQPEKGETGCVLGAGEGCGRCGRVGEPEIRTKMHQIAMQHMKKENRRNPSVFAGFLAGAEGLEPSARGFGVDVGKRTGGTGEGQCCPVLPNKSQKSGAGLVLTPDFAAIRLSFGLRIDSRLAGKILDNLSIGKDDLSFAIGGNVLVMGD